MSKLDDLIRTAKAEVSEPETVSQEVVIGGELVTFEFTKIEPIEWRNLAAKFMPRDGVMRDLRLGYNYDLLPSGYPVSHIKMVEGDDRAEVTVEQWGEVFKILEAPDIFNVSTALWGLHEWEPQQKAAQVKKALAKRKSSNSRKR